MKSVLLLLPVLAIIGCGRNQSAVPAATFIKPVKITTENQETLLPLAEGNTWVYDAQITSQQNNAVVAQAEGEIIFKASNVRKEGNSTVGTLTVTQADVLLGQSDWRIDSDGITQLSGGLKNVKFSEPEPVIKFPVEKFPSMKWQNEGEMPDGNLGSQTAETQVSFSPQIDTAVATVSGVASTTVSQFKSSNSKGVETTTTWFQPGVGIVRLLQTTQLGNRVNSTTIRLKSWSVLHT